MALSAVKLGSSRLASQCASRTLSRVHCRFRVKILPFPALPHCHVQPPRHPRQDRSRPVGCDPERRPAPAGSHRADRVGKLHQPGGDGSAGFAAHQQVRRGLSRQALLRRLRIRGHRRAAGDRPREDAVRRRGRQRAAQLRLAGQPGGVHGLLQARRHHHGHEPGRRRPPHPRHGAQHVRQVVQRGGLRPQRKRRNRLRHRWKRWRASTSRT